jgi:HPt (histidine-containing phosphotransfer) domain-containing protein
MALSESASKRLEALYHDYCASLPDKISTINAAFKNAHNENYSTDTLEQLQLPVHNLAGSAPYHNFEHIGLLARKLDKHLGRDDMRPDTADAEWRQELEKYYSDLSDALLKAIDR